jgi:hypothetical protein
MSERGQIDEYGREAMAQAAKDASAFEQAVLKWLRRLEGRKLRSYGLDLTVDQVRLEGEYPDTCIAVIMWAD